MSSEEEESSLIVECHDLATLELGHGWEQRLEESANSVSEPCYATVEYQFWIVSCWSRMTLNVFFDQFCA